MENESGPARKRSAMIWRALWTTILVGIVLFLALYDLEHFPATGFDEGTHLLPEQERHNLNQHSRDQNKGHQFLNCVLYRFGTQGGQYTPSCHHGR